MPTTESTPGESSKQFERRKQDHIRLSLNPGNEAVGGSGLDQVRLLHEALPDIDFSEVDLRQTSLNLSLSTPLLVSSMTAGHYGSLDLNRRLAEACAARGWLMGVGSQRRELNDPAAASEWREIRKSAPQVKWLGNIGLSQLIRSSISQIQTLVDALEASAMIVHLNALQECMQPEGTPQFRGGLQAIERLCRQLSVPVIIKETGCGFSQLTLQRLKNIGVAAVDVSGFGGTHWGRIEGQRAGQGDVRSHAAITFADWGVSTVESLLSAVEIQPDYEIWASGGVRSGLDAAKLLAMGGQVVGFAKPILEAALQGEESLHHKMETIEYELKAALFCTGCQSVQQLKEKQAWHRI